MLISEAMTILAPEGVERIVSVPNPYGTQTWKVTQRGADYIYCAPLERLVWALTEASDWEG